MKRPAPLRFRSVVTFRDAWEGGLVERRHGNGYWGGTEWWAVYLPLVFAEAFEGCTHIGNIEADVILGNLAAKLPCEDAQRCARSSSACTLPAERHRAHRIAGTVRASSVSHNTLSHQPLAS